MRAKNRGYIINPEDLTEELIERLAQSGINELGIHSGGGRRARELILNTLSWHKLPKTQRLFDLAAEKGITVEYDEHALGLITHSEEFVGHPEWFRVDESGNRVNDFNLCASNEDALSFVSRGAEKLARALKTPSHRYAYWIDDVTGTGCMCEKCKKLKNADQALKITNAILRGLKNADPEAITGFLAYNDAMDVPESVAPMAGVYLEYAPINRDSGVPINDKSCEKNLKETEKLPDMLRLFGTKNSRALEYWMDNSRFSNWTRPPRRFELNKEVMRADVKYYLEIGFEDITSFACYLGKDYEELYGKAPVEEYGKILLGE